MSDSFNILNEIFSHNNNILDRIENSSPLPQMNPSNISYYQNQSNFTTSRIIPESLNNSPKQIKNNSNNNPQQPETPRMDLNLNQNNEIVPIIDKSNNEIQLIHIDSKTNNTSNIINCQKEIYPNPIIQNIVSTVDLDCHINLKEVALQAKNSYYAPQKFSGLIMRIKEPKATALIFSNGKMVCLGAKNEEHSKNACKKFGKILKNLNYPVTHLKKFKIENIVSSCDVKFKIPLLKLYIHILQYLDGEHVTYEPEIFPGLIYHYVDKNNEGNTERSNIVFLVFDSGKIVIAGAKKINLIFKAFDEFYPVLGKFKGEFQNK